MNTNSKFLVIFLITSLVVSALLNYPTYAKAQEIITNEQLEVIQGALKYDVQNEQYLFDKKYAMENGFNENQAKNLKYFFESIDSSQMKQFNETFGFKPDLTIDNENSFRIAPALVAVLAFLGGAVATKLLDEIMNYGISKTCQLNQGKWAAFDDYCETNDHI